MDPITQGVIAGVIANGLTGLLPLIGQKVLSSQERQTTLNTLLQEDAFLSTILQKATVAVAKQLGAMDEATSQHLKFFLLSPDAEAIARQIFSSQICASKPATISFLASEFSASLSMYLKQPEESLKKLAESLFEALLKGCSRAMVLAVQNGLLSAHEGMSAARHRVVLDEIATVKKNLELLQHREQFDVDEIIAFEEKYRQLVAEKHSYIVPPNFDAARRVPIDKIYVAPSFLRPPENKGEEPTTLNLGQLLSALYRVVVLGNPGGGKSTLSQKLCHDLALRHRERALSGRKVTPILVVLRDYGAAKKEKGYSILQFMEVTSNSTYQLEAPRKAIEYMLLNGRALVIFDGLDELLETSFRREVPSDVELFCSLYPSVPVLVTSREVGYEQAPLDHSRFDTLRLAPFEDARVQEYVSKWFSCDSDLSQEQKIQKSKRFLEESAIVADLRANPLMLALMCNIYRGENYIPRNRPDVYEKCSVMLFEKWDKSRGIYVHLPFEAHINPAMKHLAHWIYSDEQLQAGVTEHLLVEEVKRYLCPQRFEDEDIARNAASAFITFCRGRAWVFTDTGSTADGEALYQFTHRTFLEYFTAAHLVRIYPTPLELGEFLLPRIAKREWDVVGQLAFQLQNKNVEGAAERLLDMIATRFEEARGEEKWILLSFAGRCLEFLVPSPRVTRKITTLCLDFCMSTGAKTRPLDQHWPPEAEQIRGILFNLLNSSFENRAPISDCIETFIRACYIHADRRRCELGVELAFSLRSSVHSIPRAVAPNEEGQKYWMDLVDRLCEGSWNDWKKLTPEYLFPSVIGFWRGAVHLTDIVQWHGLEGIFSDCPFLMLSQNYLASVAINLYSVATIWHGEDIAGSVAEFGRIIEAVDPPWLEKTPGHIMSFSRLSEQILRQKVADADLRTKKYSREFLYGYCGLLAIAFEGSRRDETDPIELEKIREYVPEPLFLILLLRSGQLINPNKAIANCDFSPAQHSVVVAWAKQEPNVLRQNPVSSRLDHP